MQVIITSNGPIVVEIWVLKKFYGILHYSFKYVIELNARKRSLRAMALWSLSLSGTTPLPWRPARRLPGEPGKWLLLIALPIVLARRSLGKAFSGFAARTMAWAVCGLRASRP